MPVPTRLKPNSPCARDIGCRLHPFTNAALHEDAGPSIFVRGERIHVLDDAARALADG